MRGIKNDRIEHIRRCVFRAFSRPFAWLSLAQKRESATNTRSQYYSPSNGYRACQNFYVSSGNISDAMKIAIKRWRGFAIAKSPFVVKMCSNPRPQLISFKCTLVPMPCSGHICRTKRHYIDDASGVSGGNNNKKQFHRNGGPNTGF